MWKMVKLGDVLKTGAGGTPLKSNKAYYNGGKIRWLLSGAVCEKEILKSETFITKAGLDNSSARLFPPNTVLVAMYGATAGQVGILRVESATNQAICGIYPNEKYMPEFLYYFLLSYKGILLEEVSGVAQPNLSQVKIKNIPIPVVSLAEQQRIVAKLDATFAGINEAINCVNEKIEEIDALRQTTLINVFQSIEKLAPKKHLNEVCVEFARGKSKHRPRNDKRLYGDKIPFVQTGDITNAEKYLNRYSSKYSEFGLKQSKIWQEGTVCITIAANIAELAILGMDACFPDSVIGATPNTKITSSEYLYYLLNFYQKKIKEKSRGSAQQNINLGTFSDEQFPFPSIEEQASLIEKLSKFETHANELYGIEDQKIKKFQALKSAILRQELQSEAA